MIEEKEIQEMVEKLFTFPTCSAKILALSMTGTHASERLDARDAAIEIVMNKIMALGDSVVPALRDALRRPTPDNHHMTPERWSKEGGSFYFGLEYLDHDPEPFHSYVVGALEAIGTPIAIQVLNDALQPGFSEDQHMKEEVKRALKRIATSKPPAKNSLEGKDGFVAVTFSQPKRAPPAPQKRASGKPQANKA